MGIKITPKFNFNDVRRMIAARVARVENTIYERLVMTGEEFVKLARENADFTDRTGNLRGSIGYAIFKNGEEVNSNFTSDSLGAEAANRVITDVSANFPKGYVLIVVAGMEYAAAVESKGYDVLSNSSIIVEATLKEAFKRIKSKVDKMP